MQNTDYWNREGTKKTFTHPINVEWLSDLTTTTTILDLGCGYGRIVKDLNQLGFSNIVGLDPSISMIERACEENPGPKYVTDPNELGNDQFDLVMCFALFTSCPAIREQSDLVSLINQHTHRHSLLYISDYTTEDNPHYLERYEQRKLNTFGCFQSSTAIFRHHIPDHFSVLFEDWVKIKERTFDSRTMNGSEIVVHQYLYRKGNR